LEDSSAV